MADTQIDFIIAELERVSERIVVAISTSFVANVQAPPQLGGTPRDTGWAAANWRPYLGRVPRTKAATSGNPATARAESSRAVASLQTSYRIEQGKVIASNPVPYVVYLNNGSSSQAPSGFIQRAIQKAVSVDLPNIL